MLSTLIKFFGNKSSRDIKRITPILSDVHKAEQSFKALSHEALRKETDQLRTHIQEALKETQEQLSALHKEATSSGTILATQEKYFTEIEQLQILRNQQLDKILDQILPKAFAIMRETARRFTEEESLELPATETDRYIAAFRPYVTLKGEKAYWSTTWEAAGNKVAWDMVHYDVQLLGGIVLHQGKIAEMATGEGKTLVATLPAFLNGLSGYGVHIVTVNDYLARRDAAWNAPLFEFHGLRVDCIDLHDPHSEERKAAYQADIVYGTNNEFGFDYLRDNMARTKGELVQRKHHFAIIDEVDSVLIDEARTPLIISGPVSKSNEQLFSELRPFVVQLVEAQKKCCLEFLTEAKKTLQNKDTKQGGLLLFRVHRGLPKYKPLIRFLSEEGIKQILQRTENIYLQDNQRRMPEADEPLYFTIDERHQNIELTEKGLQLLASVSQEKDFFVMPDIGVSMARIEEDLSLSSEERLHQKEVLTQNYSIKSERIHIINQLLRAYTIYDRDTEYVVMNDQIKIVDEQTGRILDGRRYSDGLHQAIEAKEQVKIEKSTQTYATITLQNYFRMYHKLSGMTGTAETEAGELWNIYKLDVTVIPTHKPLVRKDKNDRIYKTMREKFQALVEEIETLRKIQRPVLVGTTSVETSELLGRLLQMKHIKHQVLNAKQHQKEADIVAEAGKASTVTIATNMAGRGTDIKLNDDSRTAGGLAILGSERHEARRVDRQLRGRAGRQGDPGSSQFFISLEDSLMRLFGSGNIAKWMDRMGLKEGEVIEHRMITHAIERAQKKVEENNFGIRKRLLEYDNVMNTQREVIYKRRKHALFGERLALDLGHIFIETADEIAAQMQASADLDTTKLRALIVDTIGVDIDLDIQQLPLKEEDKLSQALYEVLSTFYEKRKEKIRNTTLPVLSHAYDKQKEQLREVVIPISDGKQQLALIVSLQKCVETECHYLIEEMEKTICLQTIDLQWKEHLREMDNLKQSVQNVVYEQKDPLLIYKFEAFELFKQLLHVLNRKTMGFLLQSHIPISSESSLLEADKGRPIQTRNWRESKAEIQQSAQKPAPQVRQPVRSERIAGRNEKVTVQYQDGTIKEGVKYKTVADDIKENRCVLLKMDA